MKVAIVITTYNNPRLLGICLESLRLQRYPDFSVFIADDGSTQETKSKIESFQGRLRHAIHHEWHEDVGYQKSVINNLVFARLETFDVVICIDHDVLLHEDFISDHVAAHRPDGRTLFMGRRVDLGPAFSSTVSEGAVKALNHGLTFGIWKSEVQGDSRNVFRAIRIGSNALRNLLGRDRVHDLLGSNFSIGRKLLWEINGFNEDLKSYWGEDGDLFVRARNSGAHIWGSKSLAVQLHVWHKRLEPSPDHQAWYQKILADPTYVRCPSGIFKNPRPIE